MAALVDASWSPANRAAYPQDWAVLTAWCEVHGIEPLDTGREDIAGYVAVPARQRLSMATTSTSTIYRDILPDRVAALSVWLETRRGAMLMVFNGSAESRGERIGA